MRSARGCAPREPRSTAPGSGRSWPRRGSAGCCTRRAPTASASPSTAGRDTQLPRAAVIDFTAFPDRAETRLAGLLLTIPDLVSLDLPALIQRGRLPRHLRHSRRVMAAVPAARLS